MGLGLDEAICAKLDTGVGVGVLAAVVVRAPVDEEMTVAIGIAPSEGVRAVGVASNEGVWKTALRRRRYRR